ncbi:kinase-like domain-containing protein [Abortiporus biennis]|nr:kinase-like domain-containing protein [Abortiporus biennis]
MPLPSLSVSINSLGDIHDDSNSTSLLFSPQTHPPILKPSYPQCHFFDQGRMFSQPFPPEHTLNPYFVRTYQLGDELGAGGYGFVMTAWHRTGQFEVAVKFIIKDKVPEHAWWEDDMLGRIPTEVMVLSLISHDNIVKCLDLFEDDVYFYMVQELHGTPWVSRKSKKNKQISAPGKLIPVPSPALSTPSLTPSPSTESNTDSLPSTPPQVFVEFADCFSSKDDQQSPRTPSEVDPKDNSSTSVSVEEQKSPAEPYLRPASALEAIPRPNFSRRASYDLFECIEQSKHKRLSENQARYIFAQVVDAVQYLNSQGITHCDIKDENLVIDSELKVKLIDFGSAIVADPSQPPPYHTLFFGTTAYAASEILLKKPYRAPPAEIWTLGVLLSYLLTGHSPFPTEQDAINGRVVIRDKGGKISKAALNILERCLVKDPTLRADIDEIRSHRWLEGALDQGAGSLGSTLR